MGRRSSLKSTAVLTLGMGTTTAVFYASGSLFSGKLQFIIEEAGYAKISAHSLRSHTLITAEKTPGVVESQH